MTSDVVDELETALSSLEQSIVGSTTRRASGRAVFNSITSGLTNLRRRIDTTASASSITGSARQRLHDRISTAQIAHSSRQPLEVVRQSQQQQHQSQQQSDGGSGDSNFTTMLEARPSTRSSSVLMASRVRSIRNMSSSARISFCSGDDLVMDSEDEDEDLFSKELHEQASKRARTQKQRSSLGQEEEDRKQAAIPSKVLLTRGQSDDAMNDSIMSVLSSQESHEDLAQQEGDPGSLIYSWGINGSASLHDDDTPRMDPYTSQLDTKTSRLAKSGSPGLVNVSCGHNHTACVTQSGSVYVCGQNEKGCLGLSLSTASNSTKTIIHKPTRLELSQPILQVSCGLHHTAAVTTNGTVLSWGDNQQGQLGHRVNNKSSSSSFCPPQAMMLSSSSSSNQTTPVAAAVACGHYFTLVLTNRMCVFACGADYIAPHGSPIPVTIPTLIGLPLVFIAAGHYHAVVLTSNGTAFSWGINDYGCCGRSHPNRFHVPVQMHLPNTATATISRSSLSTYSSNSTSQSSSMTRPRQRQRHPFRNWAAKKWQPNNSLILSSQTQQLDTSSTVSEHILYIEDDVAICHATCGQHHTVLVTRSGRLLCFGNINNCNNQHNMGQGEASTPSPAKPVYHPEGGHCLFVSAETGTSFSNLLTLDNNGNVWQMSERPHLQRDGRGTDDVVTEGLDCVLRDRNILSIATGGDGNHVAIAQGAATPRHSSVRRRFFPLTGSILDGKKLLTASPTVGNADAKRQGNSNNSEMALADNLDELVNSSQQHRGGGSSRQWSAEIAKRTEELLQNPAVINSLFFGPNELITVHSKLMSIGSNDAATQQTILTAIERGIKKGLDSLLPENPDHSRMIYPEAVRCLLVYIRFFDQSSLLETEGKIDIYDKFDARGTLISSLMETILNLPFEGYKAFLKWATTIYTGESYIQNLVQPLLFQLKKSCREFVDSDQVIDASLSVSAVPLIVSVLQWLHNASERLGIAKQEDFICDVFDMIPVEALYYDLSDLKKARNSKQGVTRFFICESPFLFSPSVKRNLLKMENQIEMMKAAYDDGGIKFNAATGEVSMDGFFDLEIDRNDMMNQTLAAIKKAKPSDLRKLLRIKFRGEDGVDAGGLTKEFFQLLSEDLFGFGTGMWTGDDITWFNSNCLWDDVGFELTGIIVGLALYNSVLLDVRFPMAVYRKLLGYPLGLEDMVDLELKRGFRQLLDYEGDDVEDIFCLTFEVTWTDDLGEDQERELKPGGSEIPVTSENKEEYIRLYVSWLLADSIYPQWTSFETGVLRVLEGSSIGLCRPEEVELLVVGSPELDFDALEANAVYDGGYDENSETIKCFWRFINSIDRDAQTNFLKFATGSPKAPIGGLGALNFKIQRAGPDSQQLPTSHTCFNTLILPDYGTDEKISELLGRAIVECEGFGLE